MDDKKTKVYTKPEAEIVDFVEEDIITMSQGDIAGFDGEDFN